MAAAAASATTPRVPPPPYDATMHDRLAAWLRDHDARLRAQVDRLNDDDDEDIHDALQRYNGGLGNGHDGDDDLSDSSSASGSDLTLAMMRSAQPYARTRDVLAHGEDVEDELEAVVLREQHPALAYSSDEEGGDSDLEVPVAGPRNAVPGNVYRGASAAAAAAARAVSPVSSSDDEADGAAGGHTQHAHRHHHHRHHHHEQAPAALATTVAAAQPTDARARDVVDMMRQLRRELDYVSSVMADHLPAPGGTAATGRASPGQLPAAVPVQDLLTPSTDTLPDIAPPVRAAVDARHGPSPGG
ncbi:hypothetical protein AMAG_19316 [Allomyces macrogynus ATCC 38327]|uniref:Uncharacterized protein n=1 Tax=Allomyces macrogynus (strain ATCC 38327) TaxID=578462 RepID=A0A0L0SU91_ALLM3|nr:hypothetical protein AMAG_19316 [Allomyces macrogynus ATCC 38327]|eukprot:KNE66031.1 hypothetical protein AMAG_19316 [Allomyces macrogynus ATCC 38327]